MAKKKNNNKKIKFKLGNNLMVWVMIVMASFYLVQLLFSLINYLRFFLR